MFKKILFVLLLLIIAVGVGLYVFSGKLDGIIKETIETEGTAALGSKVSVASVVTDFKQGRAEIGGLTIANPAGYQAANAIELSNFNAEVDYGDQTIKEIIINQPVINAEQKGQKNNFQDLLAKMPDSDTAEEEESTDPGPEITVKKIALQKATVNLLTSDLELGGHKLELGERSFVMQDFIVTNITGTAEEISDRLTRDLVEHVSGQVKEYVSAEIKNMAKARVEAELKAKADELKAKASAELEEKLKEKGLDNIDKKAVGDKLKEKFKLKGF